MASTSDLLALSGYVFGCLTIAFCLADQLVVLNLLRYVGDRVLAGSRYCVKKRYELRLNDSALKAQ